MVETTVTRTPRRCTASRPVAGDLRPAISQAGLTPRSPEPAFGRDDQAFRIRVERFGNEPLVDLRTVGVGGIDEGDAELDSTHQHALSTRTIKRFTPYTREPHRRMAPNPRRFTVVSPPRVRLPPGQFVRSRFGF